MPVDSFVTYDLELLDFDGKRVIEKIACVRADSIPSLGHSLTYSHLPRTEPHVYVVQSVSHGVYKEGDFFREIVPKVSAVADKNLRTVVESCREDEEDIRKEYSRRLNSS